MRYKARLVRIFDVDAPLSGLDGKYAFSYYAKVRCLDFFIELRLVLLEPTSAVGIGLDGFSSTTSSMVHLNGLLTHVLHITFAPIAMPSSPTP